MKEKPVDAQVDQHHEAILTARQRAAQQNRVTVGRLFSPGGKKSDLAFWVQAMKFCTRVH